MDAKSTVMREMQVALCRGKSRYLRKKRERQKAGKLAIMYRMLKKLRKGVGEQWFADAGHRETEKSSSLL